MARYIDREKVMEEIHRMGGHNLCEWDTIGVKALIDRQPIADVVPRSEVEERFELLEKNTKDRIKLEVFLAKQEVAREIVQIFKDYAKSDDCLTYDASDKEHNELCEIHNLGVNEVKQSVMIIARELEYKYTGEVTGNE